MSAAPLRILVVDDEPPIRKLLRTGLGTGGYVVLEAPNGKSALEEIGKKPDLVILDLGLPDIQGLELLRLIRERDEAVPIIVLSSRDDETAKVQALDSGADDYVTKPFGMNELFARIKAALRHQFQSQGERPIFRVGDLSVDLVRRIVKVRKAEVKLSPKEYDLLRIFVQHSGKVLTHKFLLHELSGASSDPQLRACAYAASAAKNRANPRATAIPANGDRRRIPIAGSGLGDTKPQCLIPICACTARIGSGNEYQGHPFALQRRRRSGSRQKEASARALPTGVRCRRSAGRSRDARGSRSAKSWALPVLVKGLRFRHARLPNLAQPFAHFGQASPPDRFRCRGRAMRSIWCSFFFCPKRIQANSSTYWRASLAN